MATTKNNNHFPLIDNDDPKANGLHPVKKLTQKITEAYGPSGHEQSIRDLIREEVKGFVDEVRVDALGNLIARKKGTGPTPR